MSTVAIDIQKVAAHLIKYNKEENNETDVDDFEWSGPILDFLEEEHGLESAIGDEVRRQQTARHKKEKWDAIPKTGRTSGKKPNPSHPPRSS